MRHFQQNVLVSEDGKKTIIERVYNTGEVEYWSVMTIEFHNGSHKGNAQVPFQIVTPKPRHWSTAGERNSAFDLFDTAFEAAKPAAHASVKESVEMRVRQENSRILLAGAIPNIPIQ